MAKHVTAAVALLDSHDPSANPDMRRLRSLGLVPSLLPSHHHVLMQLEGEPDVLSTGLYVGHGEPDELIFPHVTYQQSGDEAYPDQLRRLHTAIGSGVHGLYFMSGQEQLSALPAAQPYFDAQGELLR